MRYANGHSSARLRTGLRSIFVGLACFSITAGRVELRSFLVLYLLSLPLQLVTTGSLLKQSSTVLVVFTGIHMGVIAALFWTLLANAIVATQVVEGQSCREDRWNVFTECVQFLNRWHNVQSSCMFYTTGHYVLQSILSNPISPFG